MHFSSKPVWFDDEAMNPDDIIHNPQKVKQTWPPLDLSALAQPAKLGFSACIPSGFAHLFIQALHSDGASNYKFR